MWTITSEGRVWPCCYFANAWDKRKNTDRSVDYPNKESSHLFNDTKMMNLMNNTPNWNSLEHYSLEDITAHEVFQSYIYYPGWSSNNPPPVCIDNCSDK
jgi:hypothetical protein